MPMTEAAIDHGLTRDLYVALGDAVDPRTWAVRIHVKPFVTWIWGGTLLMAIGGLIAVADRRYRRVAIVASSAAAGWPRGEQAA
jgi:cytochrome c-type biogenesis protein CcmF